MIATSGFLTALECTKFVFGRGSAPGPTGGAYSTPPDPLAGLRGTLLLRGIGGKERRGREEGRGRRGDKFLDPLQDTCCDGVSTALYMPPCRERTSRPQRRRRRAILRRLNRTPGGARPSRRDRATPVTRPARSSDTHRPDTGARPLKTHIQQRSRLELELRFASPSPARRSLGYVSAAIHRLTVTSFRSISMPVGFRRHFVGKSLINVCYCDTA